ncbi:trypsin-like peptidase domain-containing protein [Streptomyces cocklensis]|uniref:Serine protease PepD n=1 Tax=Actinacidiphila cocklensis TaxID=887465 RepID=A0A9W4GQB9_9ACTN|nr:trypsin-like peptidase domain-containing protein [Actinacidiphila cocklensis]MDD1057068.1 trypsin-like peptidase domain-containing protein [Actinacidiphila cocklensis]CAG6393409.1 Putative serine protease PepD [Actinacidiphila cocklensis]
MSTENEAGSVPAAESAATAPDGSAPDGASAAQAPVPPADAPAPAVPAAPVDDAPRTEVLPAQAPPPVGPPSPYGPPPAALTQQTHTPAAPQPAPPVPAAAPYEHGGYQAPKPAAYDAPVPPQQSAHDAHQSSAAPQAVPAPVVPAQTQAYAQPAYGAEQPSPYGSEQPQQGPQGPQDPYAVPSTPAYASGGQPPQTQHGYGGGGPEGPVWGAPVPVPPDGGRKRRGVGGLVAAVLVAALVAGGVGGGIGYWAAEHNDDNNNTTSSTTVSDSSSQKALNRAPTSVAGIAGKALPRVVTIKASGSQESGTGTGFVYDTQGHILTNNHVVAPAADGGKLTVTFSNGKTYDAAVVGRAQGYDVAVVKLKNASGVTLSPLPLGNSDQAAVGDATIAIGAPFGLSGTVTTGIVSAVHRPVASSDGQGSSASYMSAIQTDASINPGNSGGPLLNANGAVIGINSAIQPGGTAQPGTQGGSVGLGFAIPINQAKRVADELIKTGQPVYPVMKVSLDPQYQGDGAKIGASSDAVSSGGPGDLAGLKPGDVITEFDHTIIDSDETLIGEIWQHQPKDKVTIAYTRNGTAHTTTVTLGSRVGDSPQ